jgi:hypothetical protein
MNEQEQRMVDAIEGARRAGWRMYYELREWCEAQGLTPPTSFYPGKKSDVSEVDHVGACEPEPRLGDELGVEPDPVDARKVAKVLLEGRMSGYFVEECDSVRTGFFGSLHFEDLDPAGVDSTSETSRHRESDLNIFLPVDEHRTVVVGILQKAIGRHQRAINVTVGLLDRADRTNFANDPPDPRSIADVHIPNTAGAPWIVEVDGPADNPQRWVRRP